MKFYKYKYNISNKFEMKQIKIYQKILRIINYLIIIFRTKS